MVCFLAPIVVEILSLRCKIMMRLLRFLAMIDCNEKWEYGLLKMPERLAPKKCCEVKKINPKIAMKFSGSELLFFLIINLRCRVEKNCLI